MISLQTSGGSSEEEDMLLAIQLGGLNFVPYIVKTARELDLFEIMAKARPLGSYLSPVDLASMAAPKNPHAPMMIDRLLRFLVAYSVCTCKLVKDEEGRESRAYGLGKVGKKLIKDEDGFSIAPYVLAGCTKAKGGVWYNVQHGNIKHFWLQKKYRICFSPTKKKNVLPKFLKWMTKEG